MLKVYRLELLNFCLEVVFHPVEVGFALIYLMLLQIVETHLALQISNVSFFPGYKLGKYTIIFSNGLKLLLDLLHTSDFLSQLLFFDPTLFDSSANINYFSFVLRDVCLDFCKLFEVLYGQI